jgi:nucleotide-binding universal stress UspA family protein
MGTHFGASPPFTVHDDTGGSGRATTSRRLNSTLGPVYTHLLVPVDGSAGAEAALPHVRALAERFGARVTIMRVTVAPETLIAETSGGGPGAPDAGPLLDPMPVVEAEQEEATEYLGHLGDTLRAAGLQVTTEAPEGTPAHTIVDRAREMGADLIVMSTHARGGLGRLVFGSVADSVLRHAPCPVLLIRVESTEA